ncbi:MAG TPA: hypothetical protein VKG38_16030 [Solirubrobacteraceae bacterium]|nr:hypothetical protein [Solirubrobacteraceae bacterium]
MKRLKKAPSAGQTPGRTARDVEGEPNRSRGTSSVAKVSHTLPVALAERLETFAFFQRVSESSVIEHSLTEFFGQSSDDAFLGDLLRRGGAGRRRRG